MKRAVKVLFIVPYPLQVAPSQRFRVELFLSELEKEGIDYRIEPFLDEKTWKVLYTKRKYIIKALGIFKGFIKRWMLMFRLPAYDFVFIHREAAPLGPPVFEWIMAKIFRKKIIYDFDDAIWIPNISSENNFINWFKAFWKIKYICKWSYKVTVGNDYLYEYALRFNGNVIKIPTCIDVEKKFSKIKRHHEGKLSIGWTGKPFNFEIS